MKEEKGQQPNDKPGNGNDNPGNGPKPKEYHFFIDQKKYETTSPSLTVRQILADFANVDPATKTLATKTSGGGFHEYKDLDEVISIEHPIHFTLFDNTPTQVS